MHTTLPRRFYADPEFYRAELERFYFNGWICAGRADQIPSAGDYFTRTIGDESVIVARDGSGEIHALFNVCRHRGTRLCDQAEGHLVDRIQCPYHNWTYALDGRLVDVPDREEFPSLPDDLALRPVRVETWGGFVFVHLDAAAAPLLDFLDPLPALLAPYRMDEMRLRAALTTIIDANWKAVVDAFNEGYHVQGTHPVANG